MAAKTDGDFNRWIFVWKIGKVSRWWPIPAVILKSPIFENVLEGTRWSLRVSPLPCYGQMAGKKFRFHLLREMDYTGPSEIEVNFKLACLDKEGSISIEETETDKFKKGEQVEGRNFSLDRGEDVLRVQCTMWKKEEMQEKIPVKTKYFYVRSVLKVHRRSIEFPEIPNLGDVNLNLEKKCKLSLVEFDIVLKGATVSDIEMVINIRSFHDSIKYFRFQTSIVESDGEKDAFMRCIEYDLSIRELSLSKLSPQKWIENEIIFSPINELNFDYELLILAQTDFCEFFPSVADFCKSASETAEIGNEHDAARDMTDYLRSMYVDKIFSDVELHTSTQTFPAHRAILGTRSSVFRRLFDSDMEERNTGKVKVDDLDDNTVHRMLLYLYTNSLEDLDLESAYKLYAAADKYCILPLKTICLSFIKKNVCPKNACEILYFADRYDDVGLKSFLRDYMLDHEQEVFGSTYY